MIVRCLDKCSGVAKGIHNEIIDFASLIRGGMKLFAHAEETMGVEYERW